MIVKCRRLDRPSIPTGHGIAACCILIDMRFDAQTDTLYHSVTHECGTETDIDNGRWGFGRIDDISSHSNICLRYLRILWSLQNTIYQSAKNSPG